MSFRAREYSETPNKLMIQNIYISISSFEERYTFQTYFYNPKGQKKRAKVRTTAALFTKLGFGRCL